MLVMDEDEKLKQQAEEFARINRKELAQELTDISKYMPDDVPFSIFMAGSPGAGKTEYSKNFIEILENNKKHKVIRIDADELRSRIPGYTDRNSYLFQTAVSLIVERMHDMALDQKQTFLLDGTLANYNKAVENINRSLQKHRPVIIFYVYQKPEVAWRFTQAREAMEGRNIPKAKFIDQFIASKETISRIRKEFDERVGMFLVRKTLKRIRWRILWKLSQLESTLTNISRSVMIEAT
jgi:UDP-N-acetylglucosamine kinase